MIHIRLEGGQWSFDETVRLGPPGGFGEVFSGEGAVGPVAVKRLHLTAAQAVHREMKIGKALAARSLSHVVPVLDYGQDTETDRYFLVMPICEFSLQQKLQSGLSFDEARDALLDIAAGLEEVGDVVHRDLKPGNVLRHGGVWKIADFGIAKFVEDSTSLLTLRDSLTPAYGAPEQWRGERPTKAADIYALACIAHSLLNGAPPYVGTADDVREGHLHGTPATLNGPPALAAIVSQMLRKSPESRPGIDRFVRVLREATQQIAAGPRAHLAKVAQQIAEERSRSEAAEAEWRSNLQRWQALTAEAAQDLDCIINRLLQEVEAASADARRSGRKLEWGSGVLEFYDSTPMPMRPPGDDPSGVPVWTVALWAAAGLTCHYNRVNLSETGRYDYGSTLFFGRRASDTEFRWYEVSFWRHNGDFSSLPCAIPMGDRRASMALSNVATEFEPALGPIPIDAEAEAGFQDRWLSLFARAATGRLRPPNRMPPPPEFYD